MARGINKVIIVGNLGQDPETKFMPSGGAVTNVSIATSERWKDRNTGQAQERTEWNRVVFFNRLAEIAAQYLKKGSKVYVEGSLRTRKWQNKDGVDQYTTEIVANDMQMLDSRTESTGGAGPSRQSVSGDGGPRADNPPQTQQSAGFGDFDPDIPFMRLGLEHFV